MEAGAFDGEYLSNTLYLEVIIDNYLSFEVPKMYKNYTLQRSEFVVK